MYESSRRSETDRRPTDAADRGRAVTPLQDVFRRLLDGAPPPAQRG